MFALMGPQSLRECFQETHRTVGCWGGSWRKFQEVPGGSFHLGCEGVGKEEQERLPSLPSKDSEDNSFPVPLIFQGKNHTTETE